MKIVLKACKHGLWRVVCRVLLVVGVFLLIMGYSEQVMAQRVQRKAPRKSAIDLPFLILPGTLPALPGFDASRLFHYTKIRFAPVKVLGRVVAIPEARKELPVLSSALNRSKLLFKETVQKTETGIVLELESAYGNDTTLIGRLQHGTQFKGAHYVLRGHWERTDGQHGGDREENLAASLKVDWDVSRNSTVSLGGSYFQSDIALPQLSGDQNHKKSAIQAAMGLQTNFDTPTNLALTLSGEQAAFTDQNHITFNLNSFGGQLLLKQLWGERNTLSLQTAGAWDEYLRGNDRFKERSYGSVTLSNSAMLFDAFAVDAGVRFDAYHADDPEEWESLIAPVVTTRLQLFRKTTFYATYQPHLTVPRFTDLYIRKLYTTVNPVLQFETERQSLESGIQQRLGDSVSVNVGGFYRQTDQPVFQVDENHDNLLEYDQRGSAKFTGIKANLQMNYRERFVQSVTYTYTRYDFTAGQDVDQNVDPHILPYQPNHQVQASMYWATPIGLEITCNGTYISEQFRNRSVGRDRIGKRFFINVELTQKISDNVQIFLLGRNLTDTNTYDIIPILDSEDITSSRLVIGGIRIRL